ncbi:hypothetical protein [Mycoplasma suis]|uniref:Uncharacterized protein n=1 Tax=Mycoplasma suis (strain Illinois) TaxID=768700 RepID=F0QRR1_MYCSL|nr:hypothetical protein [Mycoplasma suis]ADX98181.1 hypothetical protein MSU_0650 [Mycoplasma suis str. Illinois]
MFTFSKVITLGVLLAGGSGLSAYLIPFYLKDSENTAGKTFFEDRNLPHPFDDLGEFSKEEEQKLKDLNPLYEKFAEIVKKSIQLRDLKYKSMKELMEKIFNSDTKLSSLYKESQTIMSRVEGLYEEIKKQTKNKLDNESKLKESEYYGKLLSQLKELIDHLNKFSRQLQKQ